MKIAEFLDENAINCELKGATKDAIIREVVGLLVKAGSIKEKDAGKVVQILLDREALGSTGIGQGVAIPHGKCDCVSQLIGAVGISTLGSHTIETPELLESRERISAMPVFSTARSVRLVSRSRSSSRGNSSGGGP